MKRPIEHYHNAKKITPKAPENWFVAGTETWAGLFVLLGLIIGLVSLL